MLNNKDWRCEAAQDYLFNEVYMIEKVEYITEFENGYLVICRHADGSKGPYFVWLDEINGWSYKEIYI